MIDPSRPREPVHIARTMLCRQIALAAAFGALLLLTGCPSLPPRPAITQSWDERRSELQTREQFELKGRVAVAAGTDGFNARLRWEQTGPRTLVAIDGPLGVGGLRVASDGAMFTVATSDGEQLDSEAARASLSERLGFELPLASLRYWILGVPDPSQPAVETLDTEQRLASLEQSGWQIEYARYDVFEGRWMPERMTMRRGDVRVRLIVDRWAV